MYEIIVTKEFGRGLYATKSIRFGAVITECELLVLSQWDTLLLDSTELKHYTFKFDQNMDCLVLGDGEIFNHSNEPNVEYGLVNLGDRQVMSFVATKDILQGEQLFIDYSADVNVDVSEYIESKSLIG